MKLHEVFNDPMDPTTHYPIEDHRVRSAISRIVSKDPKNRVIGAGSFAAVHTPDLENWGDVHRTSHEDDSNVYFLDAITHAPQHVQNNPYLPRVRSTSIEGGVHTAIMERLQPFQTGSIAGNKGLLMVILNEIDGDHRLSEREVTVSHITNAIQSALFQPSAHSWGSNPAFREACEFIRSVEEENDSTIDIHDGNIMWRLTYPRPQLVITDPIAW